MKIRCRLSVLICVSRQRSNFSPHADFFLLFAFSVFAPFHLSQIYLCVGDSNRVTDSLGVGQNRHTALPSCKYYSKRFAKVQVVKPSPLGNVS